MSKTVNIVFVIFGVLFVILLLIGVGFYLSTTLGSPTDSYSKMPAAAISSDAFGTTSTEGVKSDTEFTLTDAQKQALGSFGIDSASLPSSISAEQEACFVAELGRERVDAIKVGGTPSAMDFIRVKNCI
jgi:hypothetical protein